MTTFAVPLILQTINDDEDDKQISYIKLINVGQKVITRNCHGYLPSQVAFYLQNVHLQPRKIFLSVIAESVEQSGGSQNVAGTESGVLTAAGLQYSKDLAAYVRQRRRSVPPGLGREVVLITGTSRIHHESVHAFGSGTERHPCFFTPLLNELRGGDMHGLSKQQMKVRTACDWWPQLTMLVMSRQERYPAEFDKRAADKLNYRYPGVGGESYMDVIERIRPVIIGTVASVTP